VKKAENEIALGFRHVGTGHLNATFMSDSILWGLLTGF
jgi:hypothetical protein